MHGQPSRDSICWSRTTLCVGVLPCNWKLPDSQWTTLTTGSTRNSWATKPQRGTASGVGHHRTAWAPQVCIGVETSVGVSVGEARRLAKCRRPGYEGRVRGKALWCAAYSYTGLSAELHLCHLPPNPCSGWQTVVVGNPPLRSDPEHMGMDFKIRRISEALLVPQHVPAWKWQPILARDPCPRDRVASGAARSSFRGSRLHRGRAERLPAGHAFDSCYRGTHRED